MVETASIALATFFATMGPIDVAMIYAALTEGQEQAARNRMALRGVIIAGAILFAFALGGEIILSALGISLAALQTAGGVLLLLIGIDMVFARASGATSTTADENREAGLRRDISVFPLATPLLAGPGTMSASVLLMANARGDLGRQLIVLGSLLAVLVFALVCLVTAGSLFRMLGRTGAHVITRVFGMLLSALAVQFIFDGIAGSGLLPG